MAYYTVMKTEWNNAIFSNMDEPRDYHIEQSLTEKDKYHDVINMWNLFKNGISELIYKTETDSQTQNINLWLPKGKGQN